MMAASQNLTNISTNGYKKERVVAADQFYTTLRQAGAMADRSNELPSGFQIGSGARVTGTQKIFANGSIRKTSNPLDLAIVGQGFLQVQLPSGETAYTRNGELQLNSEGEIVMANGMPIEPLITIPANSQGITIARDGTISVAVPGAAAPQIAGQLSLVNFINPTGLQARGNHLYMETAASGEPAEGTPGDNGLGEISQYALEASNVEAVEELVDLIMIQRAYEMQSKAMKVASDTQEFLVKSG